MGKLESGDVIRMSSAPEGGSEQASPTTRLGGIRERESFQGLHQTSCEEATELVGTKRYIRGGPCSPPSSTVYPPPTYVDVLKTCGSLVP